VIHWCSKCETQRTSNRVRFKIEKYFRFNGHELIVYQHQVWTHTHTHTHTHISLIEHAGQRKWPSTRFFAFCSKCSSLMQVDDNENGSISVNRVSQFLCHSNIEVFIYHVFVACWYACFLKNIVDDYVRRGSIWLFFRFVLAICRSYRSLIITIESS
jgi:hypothetical protein